MDYLNSIFQLREMLRQMERDIGLSDLSSSELDVYLAAYQLSGKDGATIQSDQIRQLHPVDEMAPATFHRALKSLLKLGLLQKPGGSKAKHYVVRHHTKVS